MKKFIIIFSSLISCFCFYSLYQTIAQRQYTVALQPTIALKEIAEQENVGINIEIENNSVDEMKHFLIRLNEALQNDINATVKISTSIATSDTSSFGRSYYHFADDDVQYAFLNYYKEHFHYYGEDIDFNHSKQGYLTNNLYDKKAAAYYQILDQQWFYDSDSIIQWHPFQSIIKDAEYFVDPSLPTNSFMVDIFGEQTQDVINKVKESANDTFSGNINFEIVKWNSSQLPSVNPDFLMTMTIVIGASVLITFLTLSSYAVKQRREVSILFLNGYSKAKVAMWLYLKTIALSLIAPALIYVVLYMIFVGRFTNEARQILEGILWLYLIYAVAVIVVAALLTLYIIRTIGIKFLKKQTSLMPAITLNMIIKSVFTIIILPLFVTNLIQFPNEIGYYESWSFYRDKIKDYNVINGFYTTHLDEVFNELMDLNGIFCDFTLLDLANNMGETDTALPVIGVNARYMEDYPIKDKTGKVLEFLPTDSPKILLPDKYKDRNLHEYDVLNAEIIPVSNTGTFYRICQMGISSVQNPVVVIVNQDPGPAMLTHNYTMMVPKSYSKQELEEKLDGLIETELSISDLYKESQASYQYSTRYTLARGMITILVTCIVYFCLAYQLFSMYLMDKSKELSLKYLNGYHYGQRYGGILLLNLAMLIISTNISLWLFKMPMVQTFQYVAMFAIVEMIVAYFMIRRFEKRNISQVLKGEES